MTLENHHLEFLILSKAKPRRFLVCSIVLLLLVAVVAYVVSAIPSVSPQPQVLPDGAVLRLSGVKFGDRIEFIHGTELEKALRRFLPNKRIRISKFTLEPPYALGFRSSVGEVLVLELNVDAPTGRAAIAAPIFSRQFRSVIHGSDGFEFVQDFRGVKRYKDGQFGYIYCTSFPRNNERLNLRIDQRESRDGAWDTIANFEFENPTRLPERTWRVETVPSTKLVQGLSYTLGEVTVEPVPFNPSDIWTQTITFPFQVKTNGVTLTNWRVAYLKAEDESGSYGVNSSSIGIEGDWIVRRGWRGPDPRRIWRLDVDFQVQPDPSLGNIFTVPLPAVFTEPMVTNFNNVHVTISWYHGTLNVSIPTNRVDLALGLVSAKSQKGEEFTLDSWKVTGSWRQHSFNRNFYLDSEDDLTEVKLAIVPNVHLTFVTQPRLIEDGEADSGSD